MKKSKLITSLILGLSVPLITTTTIFSLSNASVNKKIFYLFNNKYYSNIDEATDDYLKEYNPIKSKLHIGDFSDAIFNKNSNELDITKLKEFDRSKVLPAYKNAVGNYEHDFNKAKKSFINPGLIQYKYDDLNGKLFNSRSEAKQSMVSSTFRNPIGYYDIFLNGEQKLFNPLNKEDIKIFKEELLNDSLINPNNLALYEIDDKQKNDVSLIPIIDNDFSIIEEQKKLATYYFGLKQKFLEKHAKYQVNVKKQIHGEFDKSIYIFENKGPSYEYLNPNPDVQVRLKGDSEIEYSNLNWDNLMFFESLLHYNQFYKAFNSWIKWKDNQYLAREASIELFGQKIYIKFNGNYSGIASGVDFDILQHGTYYGGAVYFLLDIKLQNSLELKNKFKLFIQDEFTKLFENEGNFLNLNKVFYKEIINQALNKDLSYFDNDYTISITNNIFNKKTEITNKYKEINLKKPYLDKKPVLEFFPNYDNHITNVHSGYKENYLYNIVRIEQNNNNEIEIKANYLPYASILNNQLNLYDFLIDFRWLEIEQMPIENIINFNEHKLILQYNNKPIFEIPWTSELKKEFERIIKKEVSFDKLSIALKDGLLKYIHSDNNVKNEIVNNLINISTKFINSNKIPLDTNYKYKIDKIKQVQNKIMYDFDNYKEFSPSLTPNIWTKDADYKIDMALNAYNRTLEYYKLDNESNNDNKNIISKDDVIMLYDKSGLPLSMYYSEFLSNKLSFNISLMNKVNNNLYNDEAKITNAIQASQTLEPGKVVVLYDLMGNIINPGIKLSESEELLTSSDAIYDSEQTILDNLFRTKIIRPEINKVFYKHNNEYLLLKNQVDMVYSLNLNNKITHFSTYADARRYLYEYILFNAIKVER